MIKVISEPFPVTMEGTFSFDVSTTEVTISDPGWCTVFTGVWENKHGVMTNSDKIDKAHPHLFQLLKSANSSLLTAGVSTWKLIEPVFREYSKQTPNEISFYENIQIIIGIAQRKMMKKYFWKQ